MRLATARAAGVLLVLSALAACDAIRPPRSGQTPEANGAATQPAQAGVANPAASAPPAGFTPPGHGDIPEGPYGDMVRKGRDIFTDTRTHAAGQRIADRQVFPPLWGAGSYNWGAGMHELDNAAAFIQANMPLGRGGSLSDQQAWDVAMFMNSHERPQDPRFVGSVEETRARFHDDPQSLYGLEVEGRVLGANPSR